MLEAEFVREMDKGQRNECTIETLREKRVRHRLKAGLTGVHAIVAEVNVDNVTIVQPLEGTRNVDVEVKVVSVFSLIDSLEAADDVLVDVGGEWLGGIYLVVGGCMEVKDPCGGCDDLAFEERSR